MIENHHNELKCAIFITFSGNCEMALSFYQTCFGGLLQFQPLENELRGFTMLPVIFGSLRSDRITIYGSDMVHAEGRKAGNNIAIYLHCHSTADRKDLINKLEFRKKNLFVSNNDNGQKLIEVTDAFDVNWVLGI